MMGRALPLQKKGDVVYDGCMTICKSMANGFCLTASGIGSAICKIIKKWSCDWMCKDRAKVPDCTTPCLAAYPGDLACVECCGKLCPVTRIPGVMARCINACNTRANRQTALDTFTANV